jgi:hypothetical protein
VAVTAKIQKQDALRRESCWLVCKALKRGQKMEINMSFKALGLILLLILVQGAAVAENAPMITASAKISLSELLAPLAGVSAEITSEYKKEKPDSQKVRQLLSSQEKLRSRFSTEVLRSTPFVRGEIEKEEVLNSLTVFVQLAILHCRQQVMGGEAKACSTEAPVWFHFLADLTYEESSLIALRLSHLIRSLWLDEIESEQKKDPAFLANSLEWVGTLRAPWPVDRVLLAEGKKVLQPASLQLLGRVAQAYQKNPYQSVETILKKIPGGKPQELEFIKKIWRDEDLSAMKTEMNRLSLLRIQAAQGRYFLVQKKKATGYDELLKAQLLSAVPVDYFTGRPMLFPQY